jgi:hypothetical protein
MHITRKIFLSIFLALFISVNVFAQISIIPENVEKPSENYIKFITGFFEGYFDQGKNYRVYLRPGEDKRSIASIVEEKGDFALYRNNLKTRLFLSEKKQISIWVDELAGAGKSAVVLAYSRNSRQTELLQYAKADLAKRKTQFVELSISEDVYKSTSAFFKRHSPASFSSVFLLDNSDFEAIQLANILKITGNLNFFVLQKAFTHRFMNNLASFDSVYTVLPEYGNSPDRFLQSDDQSKVLDSYFLAGYSIGIADMDKIRLSAVLLKGSGKTFSPLKKIPLQ